MSLLDRNTIREALVNSEAAWHYGWVSGDDPGDLVIPVDVAAAIIAALIEHVEDAPATVNVGTLSDLPNESDLGEHFRRITGEMEQHETAIAELAARRASIVAAIYENGGGVYKGGITYKDVAAELGISAARVGQLITTARYLSMTSRRKGDSCGDES